MWLSLLKHPFSAIRFAGVAAFQALFDGAATVFAPMTARTAVGAAAGATIVFGATAASQTAPGNSKLSFHLLSQAPFLDMQHFPADGIVPYHNSFRL